MSLLVQAKISSRIQFYDKEKERIVNIGRNDSYVIKFILVVQLTYTARSVTLL